MSKQKAVVFSAPNQVELIDREIPEPGPRQLLVKSSYTLISTGTELTKLSCDFPEGSKWDQGSRFPFYPGYDNVGEVVKIGDEINLEMMGKTVLSYGSHAEYNTVSVDSAHVVPEGVKEKEAVFYTIAHIVMNGMRRGALVWGESAVVYGLGLLGQLLTRFCHYAGARPVIGVDISDMRISYLPELDGVIGLNSAQDNIAQKVSELTDERMADIVFEVTGNGDVIPEEFECLRKQGRMVIVSSPRGKTLFDFNDMCSSPSYRIIGSHNFSHPPVATPYNPWTRARHTELFLEMIKDGKSDIESLISREVPYTDAVRVYEELLDDRSKDLGVVFVWD